MGTPDNKQGDRPAVRARLVLTMKFYNYDIVFQEIPDEVTLAINITGCPNHCPECHSRFLWNDVGEELNENSLTAIIHEYQSAITCVCLMGGDQDPAEIDRLAAFIRSQFVPIKTGWYSGRQQLAPEVDLSHLDFVKLGPYIADRGPLKSENTNQHLYRVHPDGQLEDITFRFWRKKL